jgi:hypothetical protein
MYFQIVLQKKYWKKKLGIALNLGTPFEEKQGQSAIGIYIDLQVTVFECTKAPVSFYFVKGFILICLASLVTYIPFPLFFLDKGA